MYCKIKQKIMYDIRDALFYPALPYLDLAHETIESEKGKSTVHSTFHSGSGIRHEKIFGSGMRECLDPDPG
jgi:hypothetical protein